MVSLRRLLPIILVLVSPLALGRWAQLEDAPASTKLHRQQIELRRDGTFTLKRELTVELRNEEGRLSLGTLAVQYNSRAAEVDQIKAETRNGSQILPVAKEYIEDKPLASSPEGFDETRKIAVAYPKVEVGSQLNLSYRQRVNEIPIAGFHSSVYEFGTDIYEEMSEVTYESELPLLYDVHDPKKVLEVSASGDKAPFRLSIRLKKPIYTKAIDENEPWLGNSEKTYVVVSTHKEFGFFGKQLGSEYEAIQNSELPPLFKTIRTGAEKEITLAAKINYITAKLADEVRYLGDWRPTKGGHLPRALTTIASTKFGDCKDYSASLSAILRNMGYPAKIAWVERGMQPRERLKLATESAFNHAIVYLKTADRIYWVDPTNYASFAQGIFPDIAGREALIIDGDNSRMESIPEGTPETAGRTKFLTITVQKDGSAKLLADASFTGRSATTVSGISRAISKARIDHMLSKAIAEDKFVEWQKVAPFDLTSRITADVRFHLEVGVRNYFLKTSAGQAYLLQKKGELTKLVDIEPHQRVSDLFLGDPEKTVASYRIKDSRLVGKAPRTCEIKSPWVTLHRKYSVQGKDLVIEDTTRVLTRKLTNTAIRSPQFATFQTELQKCFHELALVFQPR